MKIVILFFVFISLHAKKPNLFLLKLYTDDANVSGWYMSEKLDGVRAYWDGEHLVSRNGNIFEAPAFFTKEFPKFKLDGELWSRRASFDEISSIVRTGEAKATHPKSKRMCCFSCTKKQDKVKAKATHPKSKRMCCFSCTKKQDKVKAKATQPKESQGCAASAAPNKWQQLTYNIFEVPEAKGNLLQRLSNVKETSYLKLIKQIKVKDKEHLKSFLKSVEEKGGEGVVVRDGSLPYYTGRDKNALKVKSYQDTECKIVGYNEGKGKYKDKLGSLNCKLKDGKIIKIGSGLSNALRDEPPKINSIITFKYYGLTSKGNPRFPIYLRERIIK